MRINSVNALYGYKKDYQKKDFSKKVFSQKEDIFIKTKISKTPSFRGKPESLFYIKQNEYNAKDAIELYENLKAHKYTDITHDTWIPNNELSYSWIREKNLSFLDNVKQKMEKTKFIKYYKKLTGFPDLKEVSKRMENELINRTVEALEKIKKLPYYGNIEIMQIGYNDTCSTGRGKAFPGSDIDGAYIILSNPIAENDKPLVSRFKKELWDNTDQRILSFNHQAAFPQVYTINMLTKLMNISENALNTMNIHGDIILPTPFLERFFDGPRKTTKYNQYIESNNIEKYNPNFVAANRFFIDLMKYVERIMGPQKYNEEIKNFGFLYETMCYGKHFPQFDKNATQSYINLKNRILNSDIAKFINLLQMRAIKNQTDEKPKIAIRNTIKEDFESWDIDKQYDFIVTLIKASCSENEKEKFFEYFKTGEDPYKPLLIALGKPVR